MGSIEKEFTPQNYPPFPQGLPSVELETFSFATLDSAYDAERERLFQCCKARGFFYLDLRGSDAELLSEMAGDIAHLSERVFALPQDEKDKYSFVRAAGTIFGYKQAGATRTDKQGTRDTCEFFNVAKDEMIGNTSKLAWPNSIRENKALLSQYMTLAHQTGLKILSILSSKLGLSAGELSKYHRINEESGDHVRMTRGPPRKTPDLPEIQTPGHTDFGTITLLFNWLGGLQVWSASSRGEGGFENIIDPTSKGKDQWLWVAPPKPGCAIVNLGDAAVKFTSGVLCSGRHRVVPAPGVQGTFPRYSVVYFVRPEDKAVLKALDGPGIPKAESNEDKPITAKEWILQQAKNLGNNVADD